MAGADAPPAADTGMQRRLYAGFERQYTGNAGDGRDVGILNGDARHNIAQKNIFGFMGKSAEAENILDKGAIGHLHVLRVCDGVARNRHNTAAGGFAICGGPVEGKTCLNPDAADDTPSMEGNSTGYLP